MQITRQADYAIRAVRFLAKQGAEKDTLEADRASKEAENSKLAAKNARLEADKARQAAEKAKPGTYEARQAAEKARLAAEKAKQASDKAKLASKRSKQASRKGVATSTIAKEMKIPPSFLAKIISQLHIAALVDASRGAHGGVSLAREPREISLLDVVEAIDGPILLNECVGTNKPCVFEAECLVHPIWVNAQEDLVKRLRQTRFDKLYVQ
jgi:Rrf2 family protein